MRGATRLRNAGGVTPCDVYGRSMDDVRMADLPEGRAQTSAESFRLRLVEAVARFRVRLDIGGGRPESPPADPPPLPGRPAPSNEGEDLK